jgi:hypothetical protein
MYCVTQLIFNPGSLFCFTPMYYLDQNLNNHDFACRSELKCKVKVAVLWNVCLVYRVTVTSLDITHVK